MGSGFSAISKPVFFIRVNSDPAFFRMVFVAPNGHVGHLVPQKPCEKTPECNSRLRKTPILKLMKKALPIETRRLSHEFGVSYG